MLKPFGFSKSGMLSFAVWTTVVFCGAFPAAAQDYPTKAITMVTSSPAGGGGDVLTRYLATKLRDVLGVPVVVENKPGGAGNIGVHTVTRAKPDGYTVLVSASSSVIANKFVVKETNFDAMKDLSPVSTFLQVGLALVVPPDRKATNVTELVAELKALKRPMFYGVPTTSALFGSEMFLRLTGLQGTRVNYKGMGEAASGINAGELDFAFIDTTLAISQARQGRLKVLAVSPKTRLQSEPNLPTIRESGIAFDYINFWAVWAPGGTPDAVTAKLSDAINKVVATPDVQDFFLKQGAEALPGSPAKLAEMSKSHNDLWVEIAKAAKLEPQ